jgi:hypothetical protein
MFFFFFFFFLVGEGGKPPRMGKMLWLWTNGKKKLSDDGSAMQCSVISPRLYESLRFGSAIVPFHTSTPNMLSGASGAPPPSLGGLP